MAKITLIFAALLIALGLVGYYGSTPTADSGEPPAGEVSDAEAAAEASTGKRSVTALIPAFFGSVLLLCGLGALSEKMRMHAMHAAVLVALLGAIAGAGRGFMGIEKFMAGDPTLNQRSFAFVWLMALLCAVFVGLCVNSFIQARKRRLAAEAGEAAA
ncbi:MAG: hypothetical protein AAGF97_12215 [Planctomycetota bacterium]